MKNSLTIHDERSRLIVLDHIIGLSILRKWEITIKRHTKKRTIKQNALMWKWLDEVVKLVSDHTGHDNDEITRYSNINSYRRKYFKILMAKP